MKLQYLILPIAIAAPASATIVNANNFTTGGPETLPIVDNAGNPLASGVIAVGSFGAGTDFGDLPNLFSSFRPFGSEQAISTSGFTANGGLFNGLTYTEDSSSTGDLTGGAPGAGLPVFVVVGNGSSLADSIAFAVWESTAFFTADDPDTNIEGSSTASVRNGFGSLRVGIEVTDVTVNVTGPGDITYANGIQLAPIPEPSTSLLAALAGLGLVARRRR